MNAPALDDGLIPEPVIELTEPDLGFNPRHISDDLLRARASSFGPGTLEGQVIEREIARRSDLRARAARAGA